MTRHSRVRLRQTYAQSRVPRYLQVASVLRSRIKNGRWTIGEKIATLEELENEFEVARVTVRQAIDLLQAEGLVRSYQGKGTFVTRSPENDRWLQLATDWASLIKPIRDNVPHLLPVDQVPAPRIEPGDGKLAPDFVFIRSLQTHGKEPYAVARVHVARHIYDRAPKQFRERVALAVLAEMNDLEISRAHQMLTIGTADVETAGLLAVPLNAPTAEARCVVTDAAGVVIYVGEITYRGDCVRLNIELLGGRKE